MCSYLNICKCVRVCVSNYFLYKLVVGLTFEISNMSSDSEARAPLTLLSLSKSPALLFKLAYATDVQNLNA